MAFLDALELGSCDVVEPALSMYPSSMTVVLNFDGKALPEEMKSLPSGRYVLQSVDDVFPLTRDEESGLEEAARSLDRDEGLGPDEFRAELEGSSRR